MKHIFWNLGLVVEMKTTELGLNSTNCLQQPVHLCHQWRMVIHIQSLCSSQTGIKGLDKSLSEILPRNHAIVFIILSRMRKHGLVQKQQKWYSQLVMHFQQSKKKLYWSSQKQSQQVLMTILKKSQWINISGAICNGLQHRSCHHCIDYHPGMV